MRTKIIVAGLLASMVTAAVAVAQTPPPPGPGGPPTAGNPDRPGRFGRMMQMSPEDRAAFLDARIAGLKAVLRLTAEQERHWPAFEAALREGAAFRTQRMTERVQRWREMRENRDAARPDPIQRLRAASDQMAARAAIMKKLADAGAPLYASLDENQKRRAERIMMRRGMMGHPGGMMHRGGRGGGEDGPRRGPGGGEGGRL
jgi:siderophore synthetase component